MKYAAGGIGQDTVALLGACRRPAGAGAAQRPWPLPRFTRFGGTEAARRLAAAGLGSTLLPGRPWGRNCTTANRPSCTRPDLPPVPVRSAAHRRRWASPAARVAAGEPARLIPAWKSAAAGPPPAPGRRTAGPGWFTRGMRPLLHRLLRGLDRFNAAYPWDHNAHYHRWILRQLPARCGTALDVGCGSGDLARLLTRRAAAVDAVDLDPAITARAREATPPGAPVVFTTADALSGFPSANYDAITCVAVLHHLPFSAALTRFRAHLAPGGTLVVVGVFRARTLGDHLLGASVVPLNAVTGWLKNKGRPAPRPVSMTARTAPATMEFAEIVREARRILPGARLRRRLFWRYTLVWRQG